MHRTPYLPLPLPLALAALLAGAAGTSRADDGRATARVPLLPASRQEGAACHLAYPPGMLSAASWQRLMANLPTHFGTDASVDPATLQALSADLATTAGTFKKLARAPSPPPQDRITRAAWFVHAHDTVRAATWALPAVKRAAHCTAGHTRADPGEFRARDIRIPR